jgi:hypothetical protein
MMILTTRRSTVTPPTWVMPSQAAGSVHACASAVKARGISARHAVPSQSPSGAGGVAVTDPRSFAAAAVKATARPPTWSSVPATGMANLDVRRHNRIGGILHEFKHAE